jgi:choline dehydrogenase-like flavoprotein
MNWDHIIVGAGSAGCALTHELVKSGRRVLVIEAGGLDRSPFIKIPAGVLQCCIGRRTMRSARTESALEKQAALLRQFAIPAIQQDSGRVQAGEHQYWAAELLDTCGASDAQNH